MYLLRFVSCWESLTLVSPFPKVFVSSTHRKLWLECKVSGFPFTKAGSKFCRKVTDMRCPTEFLLRFHECAPLSSSESASWQSAQSGIREPAISNVIQMCLHEVSYMSEIGSRRLYHCYHLYCREVNRLHLVKQLLYF